MVYLEVYIKHCRAVIFPEEDQDNLEHHHQLFVSSGKDSEQQIQEERAGYISNALCRISSATILMQTEQIPRKN